MDDEKRNNGLHGHKWTPVLVACLGAAFGSLGTVSIYLGTPIAQEIARPDPFTGSQGAAHDARLERIEDDIASHIDFHPDRQNQFDRRIATLEAQYAIILANQARILDRLDAR